MSSGAGVWKSGVFNCCADVGACFKSHCCPCLAMGDIGHAMGGDWCLHCCFVPVNPRDLGVMRAEVRNRYDIGGGCLDDCCCATCCGCCVMIQMSNQLKHPTTKYVPLQPSGVNVVGAAPQAQIMGRPIGH
eukprot:GDKI01021226.1.p2 GENE.GDKI01021226.1~~GDKI01021226.1.p2  ORF type:complete len:131 (+),score=37.92 GDKI01021226.1:93-485(+)